MWKWKRYWGYPDRVWPLSTLLPLSSRCNMYSNICNRRRSPDNLHCRRGTRLGNLCLKMRFLIVLLWHNMHDKNTSLVHLCCQKQT
jgi:hypothetical protein